MQLFLFNDTATTEIYTLALHDALPIFLLTGREQGDALGDLLRPLAGRELEVVGHLLGDVHNRQPDRARVHGERVGDEEVVVDRKSTRLNSSHANISYAVFCLKKKKQST